MTVMLIDAHVHVWRAAEGETPGVQTLVPPQTDVPTETARAVMARHGVERAVLVQPVFRGEDNGYVARCARDDPDRFAAVCVVDPRVAGADDRLAHWVAEGCRGLRLRPSLPDEESVFGDPSTYPLWQTAARLGVVVSVMCRPKHLETLAALAGRFGDVPIVVDHLGHPDPTLGPHDPAFRSLLALARYRRVAVKLSGFYHFSSCGFPFADCHDLIRAVYDGFGPPRMIWGSDFPHVDAVCGYRRALRLPADALPNSAPADGELVMGGNALSLYWPKP